MRRKRKAGKYSSSWIRAELRWALYIRDGFRCAWCGKTCKDDDLTLDHLFSRKHPQRDNHPSRLTVACVSCNLSKKGTSLAEWLKRLRERGELPGALQALRRRHVVVDRKAGELKRREVRGPKPAEETYTFVERPWFMDEQGVCW